MMNRQIRIIKLAERERQTQARVAKHRASAGHSAQTPGAAMTIKGWIGELRQLKRNSAVAAHSFKSLFEDTA